MTYGFGEYEPETFELGFFSKVKFEKHGKNSGNIVKSYNSCSLEKCLKLEKLYHSYSKKLLEIGINIPSNTFMIEKTQKKYCIKIHQEPFRQEELLRFSLKNGNLENSIFLLDKILSDTLKFINYLGNNKINDLGFHPTFRNYALRDGNLHYIDSFPPMPLSQNELGDLILDFTPITIPKKLKKLVLPFMNIVTDEYYKPDYMVKGIVGTACRTKPEYSQEIINFTSRYIKINVKNTNLKKEILSKIEKPPQQSYTWLFSKKILNSIGNQKLI